MIHEETLAQMERLKPQHNEEFDVIIIGAGPAGMSAGVCAARAKLKTLIIEEALPGGEVSIAFKINNFLGFPDGILGEDLGHKMEQHLFNYDIAYANEGVEAIQDAHAPVKKVITSFNHTYLTRSIIIATGLVPKKLESPFETQFLGRGVSYFAQCDGDFYSDKDVAVIGGGNCACYAADYLSQFVNRLYLIHRSDQLRAVNMLKEKVQSNPKIDIMWNSQVTEAFGIDKIEKIKIQNTLTNQHTWVDLKAIFVYIGRIPPQQIEKFGVGVDEDGFILTDEYMKTTTPGIYAAGDIRSKQIRQIATAVSDGMIAAINIGKECSR